MDVTTYFLNRTLALEAENKALRADRGASVELTTLTKRLAEVSEDLLATKEALRVAQREAARAGARAPTPPAPPAPAQGRSPSMDEGLLHPPKRQATDDEVKKALLGLLAGTNACAPQ